MQAGEVWRVRAVQVCSKPCASSLLCGTPRLTTSWSGWGLALAPRLLRWAQTCERLFVQMPQRQAFTSNPLWRTNGWPTWQAWPGGGCTAWDFTVFLATTASLRGARPRSLQGFFRTAATVVSSDRAGAWPPASGSVVDGGTGVGSCAFASVCLRALRRKGVPIKYTTKDMGKTPYKRKVMMAPNTVPWVLNASARPINKVT